MSLYRNIFLIAAFGVGTAAGQTVVPLNTLYLTSGDDRRLTIITGATFSQFAQNQILQPEYPIAVNLVIATGAVSQGAIAGGIYSLSGTFLQASGTFAVDSAARFYDGTTDGLFNYAFDYQTGAVYRFGTDWSGGQLLFDFGASSEHLGITYDPVDDTFWISGWSSNTVKHVSRTGVVLGSFTAAAFSGSLTGLALDHGDGTLWLGSQNNRGVLAQYTRSGTLLGTATYAFGDNTLGGEFSFATVPEPATGALLGMGGLLVLLARRRSSRRS